MSTNQIAWTIADTIRHAVGTEDVELIPFHEYVLSRSKTLPEYAFVMRPSPGRGVQAIMTFRPEGTAPTNMPTTYETACGCCLSGGRRKPFKQLLYEACMEYGIRLIFLRKAHELSIRALGKEEAVKWGDDDVGRVEDEHEHVRSSTNITDDRYSWVHGCSSNDPKKIIVVEAMYFRKDSVAGAVPKGFTYNLEGIRKAFAFVKHIDRDDPNN